MNEGKWSSYTTWIWWLTETSRNFPETELGAFIATQIHGCDGRHQIFQHFLRPGNTASTGRITWHFSVGIIGWRCTIVAQSLDNSFILTPILTYLLGICAIYSDLKVKAFRGMETLMLGHHYVTMDNMVITVVPGFMLYDLGVAPSHPPPNGILEGPARIPMPAHRFGFKLDLNQKNPKKDCLSWVFLGPYPSISHMKVWFTQTKKPGPMKKSAFQKTTSHFSNGFRC